MTWHEILTLLAPFNVPTRCEILSDRTGKYHTEDKFPRGHLLKIGDGDAWPHWPTFSTCSHPLTPFFWLAFTLNGPLFNNSRPTFDNLSSNDLSLISFCQNVQVFSILFLSKCVTFIFCLENWPNFVSFSPFGPPVRSSHRMTTFFGEKSLNPYL